MGAVHLLEGLNLLELARPQQFGRHTLDAQALYWTMQCARLSYLLTTVPEARLREFLPEVPLDPETRATPESAARLWAYLQRPGWIQSLQGLPLPPEAHSDGVIAVDPQGDIAVLTHTNNTTLWGSTGLFVGGVSVPDSAAFQQKLVAAAGPGGGVAHNMSPAIAMRAGRPVLAADAVGGGLHEVMLQNLLNVLAYGLSPEQAVEAPVFGSFAWSGDLAGSPDYLAQTVREGAFPEELLAEVRALGQPIEVDDGRFASSRGYWIGVRLDPETRRLEGAVTPDLNGWAIGG
jgi:gamma-glutamyltranspeptidase/glutathione hydrolase